MKKITYALLSSLFALNASSATLSSQPTENSLIIYNSNVALVHEKRDLVVKKSDNKLIYNGVADTIIADSINVKLPDSIELFSQQYRYDKLTLSKLLEAHVGRSVEVFGDMVTLLSYDHNTCLVKTKEERIISVDVKDVMFHMIPKELITKPSLVWNIRSDKDLSAKMELDYLINRVSWKSDYVLNIDSSKAQLTGWISVDNRSAKAFKNTKLYLLAGDINRVKDVKPSYMRAKTHMAFSESTSVAHQPYEGYHFYSVPFKVQLANNEKTQIKFLQQSSLNLERKYKATLSNPLYLNKEIKHDVLQYVNLEPLDLPLPGGVVRSYSKLGDKNVLLGEDRITHTPKNTPIEIRLGKNFDLKVVETVLQRDNVSSFYESSVRYKISNNSDKKKEITLHIPFSNHAKRSVKSKLKYKVVKGNTLEFKVSVGAKNSTSFDVKFRAPIK